MILFYLNESDRRPLLALRLEHESCFHENDEHEDVNMREHLKYYKKYIIF